MAHTDGRWKEIRDAGKSRYVFGMPTAHAVQNKYVDEF